jgi:hypothetical protein
MYNGGTDSVPPMSLRVGFDSSWAIIGRFTRKYSVVKHLMWIYDYPRA